MNSLRYKKQQLKFLAAILHIDVGTLSYALLHAHNLYKEWEKIKIDKRTGEIKYKDGQPATRQLRMALQSLRIIQERIKRYILSEQPFPECIHGCVRRKSNITNAKKHQGKKYKFVTDLQTFYDTLTAEKVYYTFLQLGYNSTHSEWLTKLTTKANSVPQGASTSNHLQNLVFRPVDQLLLTLCKQFGITYTRFVDDLTFSSSQCFKGKISEILYCITQAGFKINNRKTEYSANALITGIAAKNNYIDVSRELRAAAKNEKVNGINGPYTKYLNQVRRTNSSTRQSKNQFNDQI